MDKVQINHLQRQICIRSANKYSDMMIKDKEQFFKQWESDCKSLSVDMIFMIEQLANIYYATKIGDMTKQECLERQNWLFKNVEVE